MPLYLRARPDTRYTRQQIKDWADRFWWTQSEQVVSRGVDVSAVVTAAAIVAHAIDMHWDVYLANTYTLRELQHVDFSHVRLPHNWFTTWLAWLDQLASPTVSE